MHVKPFEYEWCDDWPWLTFIHQEKNSPTLGELDKKKNKTSSRRYKLHIRTYIYVHVFIVLKLIKFLEETISTFKLAGKSKIIVMLIGWQNF